MRHFLDITSLSQDEINHLLNRAFAFKQGFRLAHPKHYMASLFYENSTRTRASFEVAAQHLQLPHLKLDLQSSSENKGEATLDTIQNLAAMGIDLFVIRHQQNGLPEYIANHAQDIHVINAGDGTHAHPTQAMLDLMTISSHKPQLSDLKIAVVGNIRHSRVANSLQALFKQVGIGQLYLVAPPVWQPACPVFGEVTESLDDGLRDADVVITLRVQRERLAETETLNLETYYQDYGVTTQRLSLAKRDAIVMHPGPVNRGVEIDSTVVDGSQSVILEQVQNGVYMRMAIIDYLLTGIS